MQFPDSVNKVVKAAAEKHADDIDKATTLAERQIRKLPEFEDLVSMLIRHAVYELVCNARHTWNTANKQAVQSAVAKVIVGNSTAVNKAAEQSLFLMRIAGTILGRIKGEQLLPLADAEAEQVVGHAFNERLLRALAGVVPAEKYVEDALTERRLKTLWTKCQKDAA